MWLLGELLPSQNYKHVASTDGGEWAGPCPWCGGRDRFRYWPEHPSGAIGGRYWCRGCDRRGDAIQFLREHENMSYTEACRALRVTPKTRSLRTTTRHGGWKPRTASWPGESWQVRAEGFLAECADTMSASQAGQDYARSRGLEPDTLRQLQIGWNAADLFEPRAAWGLPAEETCNGHNKRVWLPAGLVIPSRRAAAVHALKVRRTNWTPDDPWPKYVAVSGSVPGLVLGCSPGLPIVVAESEIDAVLIWQEARDLVGALALGTASGKPDDTTTAILRAAPRILVSLDVDRAGETAWPWWRQHFPNAVPWPSAQGKDIGDMVGTPGLIRAWVQAAFLEPAA